MKSYDKDGDYISPVTGLAGLLLTNENAASRKRIIPIPESSKDEMFEQTKKNFSVKMVSSMEIQQNGLMYIQICTIKSRKMTGWQQDIPCSNMNVHTARHF